MPESAPTRESELEARAAKVGHRLYPPSAENWVIVDEAGEEPGWSTSGDLDELEEYIDAVEISRKLGDR